MDEVHQTVEFEGVSPKQWYDAYMTSNGHTQSTGGTAKIDAKVGGKMTAWDGYIWGNFTELVSGNKIVQTWRTSEFPDDAPDSQLVFTIKKTANGCQVTLDHTNIPKGQGKSYDAGWKDHYFEPMKEYFAQA
ncbi:SRPBCC domain-containing protein [Candidatus Micrarchaeota archaeon]|nr:SRPBCC domain-containing protein [Candidatus Micrarchaeota archaeon]